ncbi:MAG TPA: peptidoglycan-binding domain-containing protein [Methylomirabilota bacterium]|nr:peptidoglycan-binding domain-containing protein [Methylomirabilota bacterium]
MSCTMALGVTAMAILLGNPLVSLADAASRVASSGMRTNAVPILVAMPDQTPTAPEPRFVRDAQRALRELGYGPGPVDGVIGARTRAALTRYQQAQRLPTTGDLDAETMARLDIYLRVLRTNEERRPNTHVSGSGQTPAAAIAR